MDYHCIGPCVGIPIPYFYDLAQFPAYQTPRLTPITEAPRLPLMTEAPRLPLPIETFKTNAVDVDFVIHAIEIEAYAAVLKAFKIQSDLLSWGKEGLITELRKELNVTDQEHRMVLTHINSDESMKRIRELQQGVFHTRGLPSSVTYAPESGPYFVSSTPQHNVKLPGADVSIMQRYVAHSQPIPAPIPPLLFQNWDGFMNGQLPTYHMRNTEKPMGVVASSVTNHPKSKPKGPVQPQQKNLIHVAEVPNLKKKSGIIQICATETVLSKVQNMVFGRENPGPDQVEKAKSMLMEQERAILEALAELADVTNEDDSPKGHRDQQESQEELSMMRKWAKTPNNVYCQVD